MNAIPFVTVSFAHEFAALLLQARSLAKFASRRFCSEYIIVWNDVHSPDEFNQHFLPRLQKELKGSDFPLRIVLREELIDEALARRHKGSRVQQVLKLEAARVVLTDAYLVLDTKNHLIKPLEYSDLFVGGKARAHLQPYTGYFRKALETSLAYFDVGPGDHNPALPTTTPYVLFKEYSEKVIRYVEEISHSSFEIEFLESDALSATVEFLLYFACVEREGKVSELYHVDDKIYVTFFNKYPEREEHITIELDRTQAPGVKFLGVHRGRIANLTARETDVFVNLWVRAGLFETTRDATEFIKFGRI